MLSPARAVQPGKEKESERAVRPDSVWLRRSAIYSMYNVPQIRMSLHFKYSQYVYNTFTL